MTYEVQFKKDDKLMATWTGFSTRAEALREVRESDLLIPFTWEYRIINSDDYLPVEESLINYEDE